ncbi:MAG: Crp/Fnr family transcriptional regulator [Sphingobacterium sp.]
MTSNLESLKHHINRFTQIADQEFEDISPYFEVREARKKEILLQADNICNDHFFVVTGCLRMYFLNKKGIEHTTEFALENWWLTDQMAYLNKEYTTCYIQAVETSTVLKLSKSAEEKIIQCYPAMKEYFLHIYQKAFAAAQKRSMFFREYSREDLFLHFNSNFPKFIQRVPQYLIASYLGFTPEYLSEIRKKIIS